MPPLAAIRPSPLDAGARQAWGFAALPDTAPCPCIFTHVRFSDADGKVVYCEYDTAKQQALLDAAKDESASADA
eukprot:1623982-Prymnesium_polylepis.1